MSPGGEWVEPLVSGAQGVTQLVQGGLRVGSGPDSPLVTWNQTLLSCSTSGVRTCFYLPWLRAESHPEHVLAHPGPKTRG